MNTLALAAFPFVTTQIRACLIDSQCWFVARDVFAALDLAWRGKESLAKIKDEWKGVRTFRTPSETETGRGGGEQELLIIAEPAVYKIAFRSDKPEAERFTDRVAEIVSEIRKTGRYIAAPAEPTGPVDRYIDLTTHPDIRYLVHQLEVRFWFGASASHAAWANLRKIGGARATAFPESQVPRALAEIRRIAMRAEQFFRIKCNFEEAAIQWVFGTDAEILRRPELPPIGEQLRLP